MVGFSKNPLQLSAHTQRVDVSISKGTLLTLEPASETQPPLNLESTASMARRRVVAHVRRVLPVDSPTTDTWRGEPGDDAGAVRAFALARG